MTVRDEILQDYEEALAFSSKHHEDNMREAKEHCLQRLEDLRRAEEKNSNQ